MYDIANYLNSELKMIYLNIPERNKTLYMPEHLAECDERQYADMAKLLYMYGCGDISYLDFRVLAVYALLNLKADKENANREQNKWENVYQLSEYIDHFFEKEKVDGEEKLKIKYNFIHNHLPKLRLFKTYFGPEDGFQNVSFGQYADGLEEYIEFTKSGDTLSLRMLFAIFYLPKGEKYCISNAKRRANETFKTLDIRHLYGFYLYFTSMQEYILSGQLVVMGNEIDLNIIYQETEHDMESNIPGLGWVSTLFDIAESGVFGNYEQVRATNMWSVLLRLYELKKRRLDEIEHERKMGN